MAKSPPPIHTQFKPGQSGNPSGKRKQLLTKDKVSAIIGKVADNSVEEVRDLVGKESATMLERTVASIFMEAYEKADASKLEFLFQRSIGRVVEQIDVKQIEPFILTKRDGSQIVAGVKQAEEGEHDETGNS